MCELSVCIRSYVGSCLFRALAWLFVGINETMDASGVVTLLIMTGIRGSAGIAAGALDSVTLLLVLCLVLWCEIDLKERFAVSMTESARQWRVG